ncbi:MAG: acetylxylan esterase [Anaerolineae bacterium]|nr:acetylxylan esterase [Anaerolineae bacterium]
MNIGTLRQEIGKFLKFSVPTLSVPFSTESVVEEQGYSRSRISYDDGEGEDIPAFFLLPEGSGPFPAVLVHHQHHGERHFGKSEVCGLVGDPLQAFGPALARQGIAVLAPDSICFEDRRRNRAGTEPDEGDADTLQHFNEMCYRLLKGDTLMRKVLNDAARGLSVLYEHPLVDTKRLGTLGHSYGGNTVLFHAALDVRIRFACSSGAACTYKYKMANGIGIEMALAIPGFAQRFDIQDLVKCVAPRAILLVSATQDKYSYDADTIVNLAQEAFDALGAGEQLEHERYDGGHPVTQRRFDRIVAWVVSRCKSR